MIEDRDVDRFRRELRALVAKADDPEGFAQAVALADELNEALRVRANQLRQRVLFGADEHCHVQAGYSWADLARPLGLTRQGAAKRYGSPADQANGRSLSTTS